MSNKLVDLSKMTTLDRITAIREYDLDVIRAIAFDGIKVKKIWTMTEFAEMINESLRTKYPEIKINISTVSRWVNHAK